MTGKVATGVILTGMLVAGLLAFLPAAEPSIAEIDAMAQKRDVAGLTRILAPLPAGTPNPLGVLRTNGAYEAGKFGWRALELKPTTGSQRYVVLTTPLTSQDIGEFLFYREGNKLRYIPETQDLGVLINRHSLDVAFDVPRKSVSITDKVAFTRKVGDRAGDFHFRMSPNYRVSSVTSDGKTVPFRQSGGIVMLPRPSSRDFTYTIKYAGVVNLPEYAGSISEKEATLVNDYWYPMIARHPSTYDITVRSPKGWITAGQGERLEERETAQGRITRYRMDLPVVYFSVISAPFRVFSQQIDGRTYTVWSSRMSEAQMRAQTELYAPIVDFYSKRFGETPFRGYGAVDSQTYGGGALEAYSFATYGGWLPNEDAHEPAHTWWGGIINNTYLNSFWNESFTVFSDGLYHREVPIGNTAERRIAYIQDGAADQGYNQVPLNVSGAFVGPAASTLGYGKGGQVLQMLEQWLGTDRVVGAMRTWLERHPKGEPGNWEDFERVLMETKRDGEGDIKGFFDDWVRRPGYADFDADVAWANQRLTINLKWKSPRYRMPLTVLVQQPGPNGARTVSTVFTDGTEKTIELPAPVKPELVSIDPYRQAVRRVAPAETPTQLDGTIDRLTKVIDPAHKDWLPNVGRGGQAASANIDPAGKFIVGSPETLPALRSLCDRVGFQVEGNTLTYQGTTIDLTRGSAIALVDLADGKTCAIGLGKVRVAPNFGRARLIVTDDLGRMLRGVTDPKTKGPLTYRL